MKLSFNTTLRFVSVCIFVAATSQTFAQYSYTRQNYKDVRMLGRGNAGLAFVDDGTAAFLNPAGLASARAVSFRAIDFSFGGNQSFRDSYSALAPMLSGGGSSQTLSEQFAPFLGKPLGIQGSFFPHVMAPGFLFGGFDYFDLQFLYTDPVYPELAVDARNDYGLIFGYGNSIMNRLFFGASIRYQNRKLIQQAFTADTMATASLRTLQDAFLRGDGYGLNIGTQFKQPIGGGQTLGLGITVEDVGQTRFKSSTRDQLPPPKQFQSINAGIGYVIKSTAVDGLFAFDVHDVRDRSTSFTKKIFTGLEINLPTVDFRGGLYQGYWTLGMTLRMFPLIEIDFTSYAEELGVTASQKQNRWYMLGMTFGMDLKGASVSGKKKQRYSIDKL